MKKFITIVLAVVMALSISVTAMAQELDTDNSSGSVVVSVVVPDSHGLTVNYNDGGYVKVNGEKVKKGDTVEVERLSSVTLSFITRSGYRLESVKVDGMEVINDAENGVINGVYKTNAIIDDMFVDVKFVKDTSLENVVISGKVVDQDDNIIKGGTIVVDGSENVEFKTNGDYELPALTDGRHELVIKDKDGNVIGTEEIVIEHKGDVDKIVVKRDNNDTQVLYLPTGTKEANLNLRVYLEDSEDGKNDKGDIEIVVVPPETDGEPTTGDDGETGSTGGDTEIGDMGDTAKTQLFAIAALASMAVIFALRKKSKSVA